MGTYLYHVVSLGEICPGVFELVVAPSSEGMPFLPGQYVEFLYPDGNSYPFSIANARNADDTLTFYIRLAPDDHPLEGLLVQLDQTQELSIQGPMGESVYEPGSAQDIILLAGGTGIGPMKAIIDAAPDEENLHLFWGVTSPSDLFLHEYFSELQYIEKLNTYLPVVSGHEPWRGVNGWAHEWVIEHFPDLTDKRVYASGPFDMIYSARELFSHYGLADDAFKTDIL